MIVFGAGGVGISIVQGARIAGAYRIIVSDPVPTARARGRFGATDVIDPTSQDVVAEVKRIVRHGADYGFDAIGRPEVVNTGIEAIRAGGRWCVSGFRSIPASPTRSAARCAFHPRRESAARVFIRLVESAPRHPSLPRPLAAGGNSISVDGHRATQGSQRCARRPRRRPRLADRSGPLDQTPACKRGSIDSNDTRVVSEDERFLVGELDEDDLGCRRRGGSACPRPRLATASRSAAELVSLASTADSSAQGERSRSPRRTRRRGSQRQRRH